MDYSLLWNGVVRTVRVPEELEGTRERWTWATVCITGGTEEAAWRAALSVTCPGLGWSVGSTVADAKSFDACVFGGCGPVDTSLYGGKTMFHTPTHRAPRPDRAPYAKSGGSGSAGPHRQRIQRPTSSASSHPGPVGGVGRPQTARLTARPTAKPGRGGWQGRSATRPTAPSVAPHA
jgi:hypothetical protein